MSVKKPRYKEGANHSLTVGHGSDFSFEDPMQALD